MVGRFFPSLIAYVKQSRLLYPNSTIGRSGDLLNYCLRLMLTLTQGPVVARWCGEHPSEALSWRMSTIDVLTHIAATQDIVVSRSITTLLSRQLDAY